MGCSLRTAMACGVAFAIIDIIHSLGTLGFYGYQFMLNYFYLCPKQLAIDACHNERYLYEQRYELRSYIGLGEGVVALIFDVILIISFVKYKPCLVWMWMLKCTGIIGINIFFISDWMIRGNNFDHINHEPKNYEGHFLFAGIALTLAQVLFLIIFLIIAATFTYKVSEERTRSRRSLRNLHPRSPKFRKNSSPSAPSLGSPYDEDDAPAYMNSALHDSTNKLPLPGSNGSIDNMSTTGSIRQPTAV